MVYFLSTNMEPVGCRPNFLVFGDFWIGDDIELETMLIQPELIKGRFGYAGASHH